MVALSIPRHKVHIREKNIIGVQLVKSDNNIDKKVYKTQWDN